MRVRGGAVHFGLFPQHHLRKDRTVNKYINLAKTAAIGAVATLAAIYVLRKLPVVGPTANGLVQKAING